MASSGLSAEKAVYREERGMSGVTFFHAWEAVLLAHWYKERARSHRDAVWQE